MPFGPYSLCPLIDIRSMGVLDTSTGTLPTACMWCVVCRGGVRTANGAFGGMPGRKVSTLCIKGRHVSHMMNKHGTERVELTMLLLCKSCLLSRALLVVGQHTPRAPLTCAASVCRNTLCCRHSWPISCSG
jgi:hypothetical protein